MIYTADRFAAHLRARGADVTFYDGSATGFLWVHADHGIRHITALFRTGGRFKAGQSRVNGVRVRDVVEWSDSAAIHTRKHHTLKSLVDALHLPPTERTHRDDEH